jgi:hypothetical protein
VRTIAVLCWNLLVELVLIPQFLFVASVLQENSMGIGAYAEVNGVGECRTGAFSRIYGCIPLGCQEKRLEKELVD